MRSTLSLSSIKRNIDKIKNQIDTQDTIQTDSIELLFKQSDGSYLNSYGDKPTSGRRSYKYNLIDQVEEEGVYTAAPTIANYILSNKFVNLIVGPVGSGKSLGSIVRWHKLIYEQEPNFNGIRYTRAAFVRNSFPELRNTTIKSIQGYFKDDIVINWGNMTGLYAHGDIHAEIIFLSLDNPKDMAKLLSLEISFAFMNEGRELPQEVMTNITTRLARYPSRNDGPGTTNPNLFIDSNASDDDNYLYKVFVEDLPENYGFFLQPPAILKDGSINPDAENLNNLDPRYYGEFLHGKPKDFIDVMIRVKWIPLQTGKPVYPEYDDGIHCIDKNKLSEANPSIELSIGAENGRTSAFVISQVDHLGRVVVFDEILSNDIGSTEFGQICYSHLALHYPKHLKSNNYKIYLDPAAGSRTQLDDNTQLKMWRKIFNPACVHLADTNKPSLTTDAVKHKLNTWIDKWPSLIISSKCKNLRKAFNGAYQYKRMNVSGDKYSEKPDKGPYSHVANACEYLIIGVGGIRDITKLHNPIFQKYVDQNNIGG